MRIRFSVQATVFCTSAISAKPNGMRQFPADVINRVIVCNKDGCSYQHITDVKKGRFEVDFDLAPVEKGARLCNTLKFHLYTGNSIPIVVAAGAMSMIRVQSLLNREEVEPSVFQCNFAPVKVQLDFVPHCEAVCEPFPDMEPSTIYSTENASRLVTATTASVAKIISNTLNLNTTCGAPMFCNLMTAHNFMDEATSHFHFQGDVEPTFSDSKRFYKTGLTTTALAEAFHANCLTPDEVMAMDESSREFTQFVSSVCQSFVRSAHLCPYVSDKVMSPMLDSAGQVKHMLSESFKLPFREPFDCTAGYLCADDCEGQATFMLHLFRSFQHLHEKHEEFNPVAFPHNLFDMSEDQKRKVWDVAIKIGKAASQKKIRCDLLLISAGGASLGEGGASEQVGGHATSVLVNASDPNNPIDLLMEGTNSMQWEDDEKCINVMKDGLVPISIPMVQVANLLTENLASLLAPVEEPNCRKVIHLNKQLETKFYKTAFCQNGILLASVGESPTKLNYGVNMDHISDYTKKVLMPITAQLVNKVTEQDDAHDILISHFEARKAEIHPPPVSKEVIARAISRWSKVGIYTKNDAIKDRKYKICLTMRSIRDPAERLDMHNAAIAKLAEWNAKYKDIGFCDSYVAFDTMFTRLCMWTDNIPALQKALSNSLSSVQQK
jgi:hypothetical protein